MMKTDAHPHLRLVVSHRDLCKSNSFTAASPLGSAVRSHSISLMDEGDRPTRVPISASVNPVPRRSDTRDAHVLITPSLRVPVELSQRLPVTDVRDNMAMPRPAGMPTDLNTIGRRVRWWRTHRKLSRRELAKDCKMSPTALSDLELDRTEKGTSLHLIAARLGLNAHYLETGKGEPEAEYAQEAPDEPLWPFPAIPLNRLDKLNLIERSYAESKLLEALADIEAERRKAKRLG